jgi:hypothetical protein
VGFIKKGLLSYLPSMIDDDAGGDDDTLFDPIWFSKIPSEAFDDCGECSSPLSCVTENKKK